MRTLLILPKLSIEGANALSSPFTYGFPAMTAWLGFVHALERKVNGNVDFKDVRFDGVGVVNHRFNTRIFKAENGDTLMLLERHPKVDGVGGQSKADSSMLEEPKCDLEVSIIINVVNLHPDEYDALTMYVENSIMQMKVASGDLIRCETPVIKKLITDSDVRELSRFFRNGTCLIDRSCLVIEGVNQGLDSMDAILDALRLKNWKTKKYKGWLVPIAVGYQGISPISDEPINNQRNKDVPHRFAESVVTLGEFVWMYKIKSITQMLWSYNYSPESGLYACKQNIKLTGEV